jgi:hypothetical protein
MLIPFKSSCLPFLILIISTRLCAQANNNPFVSGDIPRDSTFWKKVTVEQMLGLPQAYKVSSCSIHYVHKDEFIYIGYNQNPNMCLGSFDALRRLAQNAKAGDKILLSDIMVVKGDRKIKWAEKAILFK